MGNIWLIAALWVGLALVASVLSIRVGIAVARTEIVVGAVAGNIVALPLTPWVNFLARFDVWLALFAAVTAVALWLLAQFAPRLLAGLGERVSEPQTKFVALVLLLLGGLASIAGSEAVLPAYLVGMVLAPTFLKDRELPNRMRIVAFSILTPFYFLKAGSLVQAHSVVAAAGLIVAFLAVKMAAKFAGILPLTRAFRFVPREGMYTTLLMSTGLTFGTISALFGLTNHIVDQQQYTILVTVVIGSAVVPTLIAQRWFMPAYEPVETGDGAATATQPALAAEVDP